MKHEILDKFKELFEEQKKSLAYSTAILNEDFHIQKDETLDDVDLTSVEMESSMRMRLRNRQGLYLKKIDAALAKIEDGSFGCCEDCGEDIELKRLEARPTATLCISCKEATERKEDLHYEGLRHKSLGVKLKVASF